MKIKSIFGGVLNKLGFKICRIRIFSDKKHERVLPGATYAPWNNNEAFLKTYMKIDDYTLVDKYRCFELWTLIEQSKKLKYGSLIEIGIRRGGTGALIATQALHCGIADSVYLCDTFTGIVKAGANDSFYENGAYADTSRKIVEDLLFEKLHLDNIKILEGIFPEETSYQVENEKFRFCHIDVDVYQSANDIVDWIWGRMVPGGIIVYDDYGFYNCDGITKHVNEQIPCEDRLVLHNLNGHAIIIKL